MCASGESRASCTVFLVMRETTKPRRPRGTGFCFSTCSGLDWHAVGIEKAGARWWPCHAHFSIDDKRIPESFLPTKSWDRLRNHVTSTFRGFFLKKKKSLRYLKASLSVIMQRKSNNRIACQGRGTPWLVILAYVELPCLKANSRPTHCYALIVLGPVLANMLRPLVPLSVGLSA